MNKKDSNLSKDQQDFFVLSFIEFNKIKNGIKNTLNDVTEGEEKEHIINDLENILKMMEEIEKRKEEEMGNELEVQIKEYDNGLRNGKGNMTWKDGDKYEGNWKNGKFDGDGIYYFNNGDRFEGEFKNDACVKGTYFYENGDRYEGEIKNWKSEGKGR